MRLKKANDKVRRAEERTTRQRKSTVSYRKVSKGKNSADSSKSPTSSADTATVDSNVGDPDSDATASELPQVLPLSKNPEPGIKDIDTDRCCMCFASWQDSIIKRDGFFCLCGQWLHEDCVEDVLQDQDGNQRFCIRPHFCIQKMASLIEASLLHSH